MVKKEAIFIAGAIAIGIAAAGSLFMLFPDMMFKNTGFSQSGTTSNVPIIMDTNNPTTTASITNNTNSTANATALMP